MATEKSDATTFANFPEAAKRLEKSPEPQETSRMTPPPAPAFIMYSMAIAVSASSPGNPAHAKLWRHPFSYTELMSSD